MLPTVKAAIFLNPSNTKLSDTLHYLSVKTKICEIIDSDRSIGDKLRAVVTDNPSVILDSSSISNAKLNF